MTFYSFSFNSLPRRQKMSIRDFEPLSIIGKGAFGEVRICRDKLNGRIVAIKKMKKEEMHKKNQILHMRTEKEILVNAKSPWVVSLRSSFQDDYNLYLVMDFCSGGDFMSLLMRKDILNEEDSRFYIAELILAVEAIHKIDCIHRDLKPDNVLINKKGHLQLSDFGLSKLSVTYLKLPLIRIKYYTLILIIMMKPELLRQLNLIV